MMRAPADHSLHFLIKLTLQVFRISSTFLVLYTYAVEFARNQTHISVNMFI
jgi:hypothetical protein